MLIAFLIEQFNASKIFYHAIEVIFGVQTTLVGSWTRLQERERKKNVLLLECLLLECIHVYVWFSIGYINFCS